MSNGKSFMVPKGNVIQFEISPGSFRSIRTTQVVRVTENGDGTFDWFGETYGSNGMAQTYVDGLYAEDVDTDTSPDITFAVFDAHDLISGLVARGWRQKV